MYVQNRTITKILRKFFYNNRRILADTNCRSLFHKYKLNINIVCDTVVKANYFPKLSSYKYERIIFRNIMAYVIVCYVFLTKWRHNNELISIFIY